MRKRVGYVAVDSGQLMIIDPCGVDLWDEKRHYTRTCQITRQRKVGQLTIQGGMTAVVSGTGFGDGRYPVYATFDEDGWIEKLEVVFQPIP
ncbi:MAG: DUF4241 domain-containing protein [Candidatus Tectomicrobia bacterium]|nr:DUF4241 domain-containing protein [Candidatus Tectomicrobia bacterium]